MIANFNGAAWLLVAAVAMVVVLLIAWLDEYMERRHSTRDSGNARGQR